MLAEYCLFEEGRVPYTVFFFSGLAGIQNARQAARQDLLSVLKLTTIGAHYFEHACFISENDLFV